MFNIKVRQHKPVVSHVQLPEMLQLPKLSRKLLEPVGVHIQEYEVGESAEIGGQARQAVARHSQLLDVAVQT